MKKSLFLSTVAMICATVSYIFYVTLTKGDGFAFAAFIGVIAGLAGVGTGWGLSKVVRA